MVSRQDIRKADTEALECLDYVFHAFERIRKNETTKSVLGSWGTYRYDLCVRCGTVRRRIQSRNGTMASSPTYDWPDAYLFAKQFDRADARKELDRRAAGKGKGKSTVIRGGRGQRNLRVVG